LHVAQSDAATNPVAVPYVPMAHGAHVNDAAVGWYRPFSQAMHAASPLPLA
jgi:hypothetical protein